jgi:hypothetical protein
MCRSGIGQKCESNDGDRLPECIFEQTELNVKHDERPMAVLYFGSGWPGYDSAMLPSIG